MVIKQYRYIDFLHTNIYLAPDVACYSLGQFRSFCDSILVLVRRKRVLLQINMNSLYIHQRYEYHHHHVPIIDSIRICVERVAPARYIWVYTGILFIVVK